tara:strand:+ start:413 stop:586 length:174 start_codon:yes stop_codon:yes gene_type:complete
MQSPIYAWGVLILGILLLLPNLGITALGNLSSGFVSWAAPIIIIIIGIVGITKVHKK